MLRTRHQNFPLRFLLAVLTALAAMSVSGQANYTAFELQRERNFAPLLIQDINGDGAMDLVYAEYRTGIGRELLIYLQQANGVFSPTPRRVEIKTEIIAVGFADLRPAPGVELLLYANNAVYSLDAMQDGYAGNLKHLVDWNLTASMPELEDVQFFDELEDLNNDGLPDLVLPGIDSYGIFYGAGDEQFELVTTLSTINASTVEQARRNPRPELDARVGINAEDGIVLELNTQRRSAFTDFIEQWQEQQGDNATLLESEHWMPALVTAHLNGDELLDLAYINVGEDGLGQLNLHYQKATRGFTEQPDWYGSIDTRGALRLVDMNQDQVVDLLRLRGDGDEWSAQLYLNTGGHFELQQPNQVMRFAGYDVDLDFLSLAPGTPPILNVSYYTIPVVDAIRNASINRIQLLYGSDQATAGQLFNRRPDSRLEESFSAANVRGLSEQMSLRYDVDGDSSRDALYITDNGTLAAKRIDGQLQIASEPFWEYVSTRSVFEFDVVSLNADNIPDLLLRHGTATTVLVGRP